MLTSQRCIRAASAKRSVEIGSVGLAKPDAARLATLILRRPSAPDLPKTYRRNYFSVCMLKLVAARPQGIYR